jgi:hypothetical protein
MSALGTEENGYLHRFFAFLNCSKDAFETSSVQVQIPETIVLNMGIIVAWFFTSKKDGSVRRKKRVNMTKENVAAMLHANLKKNVKTLGSSNGVVPAATVTYNATDDEGLKIQSVSYLMENEVDDFLRNTPVKNCLVQQWIHPCGNQNSVLHCLWTPSGVQISRRNARNLLDDRAPAAFRFATYESGAMLPGNMSLCTSTTKSIIKNTCNHIAQHLATIAAAPSSMTTYWKISSDLRVVLLWCSLFTKVGDRKKRHIGPSVSPIIQLSNPQTETQISLPICPFCKNIAGMGEPGMHKNSDLTPEHASISIFGDCGIKSISFGAILDFCLNRGAVLNPANKIDSQFSVHHWKFIPQEFRSLKLGYNLKQFNSESSRPEFRHKSVSVCERCYNKYTHRECDIHLCETQSKARDFGNPAFAILPPTFCSSYTIEAYEKHFERLRGSDAKNPKIKLAIKELSRVWDDSTHDPQPSKDFLQTQIAESFGRVLPPYLNSKSQLLEVVNEHDDRTFSNDKQYESNTFPTGSKLHAKHAASKACEASSRSDEVILKTLPEKSAWVQSASSGFIYNIFDSLPDLQTMFQNACSSCKRPANEQRLRGLSLSMADWLNFCKNMEICTLMPLKTSNCIAAFIHANKFSSDPDENQMNLDEFGSAIIFLAAKAHVLIMDDSQSIPSAKSCSGVVLAGVKRFLAGIGVHDGCIKPQTKILGLDSKHLSAKYYADVAELDSMFDDSNYDDDLPTFELWHAIPTIPRMFERVASSDSSAIANMGIRSTSVSMQEWMKFCDDLRVVQNLPLKRSDCVVAFVEAVNPRAASAAHQEMNIEQFSQGLIHLALASGIWGDLSTSKPSAKACSGQIIRGIVLMLKELLCGTSLVMHASSSILDDPLQLHAMSHLSQVSKIDGVAIPKNRPTQSLVFTAPLWQDIPTLVPLFSKVCQLRSAAFISKRSNTVSMPEWMQMCDECRLTTLLPISRTDCISAFLYSNKSIVSDGDMHELDLVEFCQSLIFLAAKSGILGNVDLSSLPSAGSCNDDVSRGVTLLVKEAKMEQYVGMKLGSTDDSSRTLTQRRGNSGHDKKFKDTNAIVTASVHELAITDNVNDADPFFFNDHDNNDITFDHHHAEDEQVADEMGCDQGASDAPRFHRLNADSCKHHHEKKEVIMNGDNGENSSCDSSCQSSSTDCDLAFDPIFNGREIDDMPSIWIMEPSINSLFRRLSGGSERLSMQKLLQFCRSCNFLEYLKLSSTQFMRVFAKPNLGFDANENLHSGSLSLNEFCQGLIVISCKFSGSSRNGTNFPSAKSCPKSVARSVVNLLLRKNMLLEEDFAHSHSNRDLVVPKLQIPPNISVWLSSESAAKHKPKISPLFAAQCAKDPQQKTLSDLYADTPSGETSRLLRRQQALAGSQSARSAPVPPMQSKTASHGARSARFMKKL